MDYSGNAITDTSLPSIIKAASENQYHTLGLADLQAISSEGIAEAFENQDLSHLVHLDLSSNGFGEEEVIALSAYLPALNLGAFGYVS